jgi:hypothetical protein
MVSFRTGTPIQGGGPQGVVLFSGLTSEARKGLEVEPEFDRLGSRRYIVGAAEGRQKVVQRRLVCQIDDRESQAPLVAVAMEKVIVADGNVKQMARLDSWGIVVVVFGSRLWDLHQI